MIKKYQIELILLQLQTVDREQEKVLYGLLYEDLSLGVKRKLQKIFKELIGHHTELQKDLADIEVEYKDKDTLEDRVKKSADIKELKEEEIELKAEPALLSEIEKVSSKFNYDFDLIELITK